MSPVTSTLCEVPGAAGTGTPVVKRVAEAKLAAVIGEVEYRMSNCDAFPSKLSSPGVVQVSVTLFHGDCACAGSVIPSRPATIAVMNRMRAFIESSPSTTRIATSIAIRMGDMPRKHLRRCRVRRRVGLGRPVHRGHGGRPARTHAPFPPGPRAKQQELCPAEGRNIESSAYRAWTAKAAADREHRDRRGRRQRIRAGLRAES